MAFSHADIEKEVRAKRLLFDIQRLRWVSNISHPLGARDAMPIYIGNIEVLNRSRPTPVYTTSLTEFKNSPLEEQSAALVEYDYPTQLWNPVVKNWFSPDAYKKNDKSLLLYPNVDYDAWVLYKESASVRLSIKTKVTNDTQPLLELEVTAGFEPAGYEEIPRFLGSYQDKVGLKIQPNSAFITSLHEYKADLNKSANKNKVRETEHVSGSYEIGGAIGANIIVAHAGIHGAYHSPHTVEKYHANDFDLSSKASQHDTSYSAVQQSCYYPGKSIPYPYNPNYPHDSMHWIGLPDYFCDPTNLAKGGLVIHSTQSYVLNTKAPILSMPVKAKASQRLVGMSTWMFGRNFAFVNYGKVNYSFELSVRGNESFITKAGFFSDRQARINGTSKNGIYSDYVSTVFDSRYVEQRRGDSPQCSLGKKPGHR